MTPIFVYCCLPKMSLDYNSNTLNTKELKQNYSDQLSIIFCHTCTRNTEILPLKREQSRILLPWKKTESKPKKTEQYTLPPLLLAEFFCFLAWTCDKKIVRTTETKSFLLSRWKGHLDVTSGGQRQPKADPRMRLGTIFTCGAETHFAPLSRKLLLLNGAYFRVLFPSFRSVRKVKRQWELGNKTRE